MLRAQHLGQLHQGDVLLRFDRGQDRISEGFDAVRARVAALGFGADRTRGAARADPPDDAGGRNAESLGRGTAGHAAGNGRDQPGTKIDGKRLAHARRPPVRRAW